MTRNCGSARRPAPESDKEESPEEDFAEEESPEEEHHAPQSRRRAPSRKPVPQPARKRPRRASPSDSEEEDFEEEESEMESEEELPKRGTGRRRGGPPPGRRSRATKRVASEDEEEDSDEDEESESEEESDDEPPRRPQRGSPSRKKSMLPDLAIWPSVPMTKITEVAGGVLDEMRELDVNGLFGIPVLEAVPGIKASYLKKIKNPMDFRTIEEERAPAYERISRLQDDLILVFQNCVK